MIDERQTGLGDLESAPATAIWDGVLARSVQGERLALAVVELDAGSVVPEHRHEHEQLGLVLQGEVTFTVGSETRRLGPGGTWSIPSGVPHTVETGPDGAVVIDVFSPPRDDWGSLPAAPARGLRWPLAGGRA